MRAAGIEIALLDELRHAMHMPFADPVGVRGVSMTRAEARAMERGLLRGLPRARVDLVAVLNRPANRAALVGERGPDLVSIPAGSLVAATQSEQSEGNSTEDAAPDGDA